MDKNGKGLVIIFHSGSFDRIHHGLSIALTASVLGRNVRLFFTYWALEYLKKDNPSLFVLDKEAEGHKERLEENIRKGHLLNILELVKQTKAMGSRLYVCTSSMGLLNIARNEFIEEVGKSMGITTFLSETTDDDTLFI